MRTAPLLALPLLLASSALAQKSAPALPFTPTASPEPALNRFLKIRTPGAPALAPDGTLYVRDWPDGIYQLYRVEGKPGSPNAPTTRLTNFPDGLAGYSLSPDGSKILLAAAPGGNENTQLSLLDPKANGGKGAISAITQNPKAQYAVNLWLRDSSGFIYTGNDASANDFYIYRYDLKTGKPAKLLGNEGSWSAHDLSADTSRVLVAKFSSASDSRAYELDTKTGNLSDITVLPSEDKAATAANEIIGYMPGDSAVLMTSDAEEGIPRLFLRDLKSGRTSKPIPALDKFEIDAAGMNPEKTLLLVSTNEDGYSVPHIYRLPGFEPVTLPAIEKGVISVGHVQNRTILYSVSNARTPGLSYMFTVPEAPSTTPPATTQITFADTQGLDLSVFPLPELVKYKSFDGLKVPAFVFLPPNYRKGTPIPFILNYHGGPEGQHRPAFSASIQYLLSEGFGVMQPNVRGSTGYGRAYQMMDDYKKRWDSVRDGVDAAEWLVQNGYSTPGKMATYGGSYGGFMSVACLVEDQLRVDEKKRDRRLFGAGVDVVGIVNMKTFLEKTSGYRRKLREAEYGPLSDPEFLATVSSMNRIDKINVPMFIAHGFNDPRVPVEEAMQVATALKDRGVPVRLFIAPDEGHGFQKLDNRLYFTQRMASFLKDTIAK